MDDGDMRNDRGDEPHGLRPGLKPAQEHVLAALADGGAEEFTRSTYEEIAHVSRSQAAYDLADLVKLGLVDRLGAGRATRYRIAREGDGRRRKWTSARIRDELERFCGERGRWPRAAEFKEAGHGSLYLAASRYGGIEHWATELGFSEAAPSPAAGRRDVALDALPGTGLVAAALAGLFVLGIFLIVQLMPDGRSVPDAPVSGAFRERVDATPGAVARERLPAAPAAARVALVLAASGDGSWIAARRGAASGPLLWKGTLEAGDLLRLRGRTLWLRVTAPANLLPRVDGKTVALPERTSTLLVTGTGIRVLETAPAPSSPAPSEAASSSAQPVSTSSPPSSSSPGTTDDAPAAPSGGDSGPAPELPPVGGSGPAPDPPPGG
ncbi:MAG: hypothetical protein ACRDNR_05745 [Gaiellaceae bacterium]